MCTLPHELQAVGQAWLAVLACADALETAALTLLHRVLICLTGMPATAHAQFP